MKNNRISLWSGPRNISTAMMYSFAQRSDTTVVDEPLYAYFLEKTGIQHPGREETLQSMSSNLKKLQFDIEEKIYPNENVFFKNMGHHFLDLPYTVLDKLQNVFLIREPCYVIASYIKERANPSLNDLGYNKLLEMTDYLMKKGLGVFVIDSKDILKNPEAGLRKICEHVNIEFKKSMLKWNKGGIEEDGPWAKYWYKTLHQSESFMPYREKAVEIPKRLKPLLRDCEIIYEILQKRSVKIK